MRCGDGMHRTVAQINEFMATLAQQDDQSLRILEVQAEGVLWCLMPAAALSLRPGGSVSGPSLMTLADAAMYACVLHLDIEHAEMAVTQSLHIQFLRRPQPGDLHARVEALRRGRHSVVLDVRIYSEQGHRLVAQASGVYALPRESLPRQDF